MRYIFISCMLFVLLSCEKDKFTTKPKLTFKSVNSHNISGDQTLEMRLTLTDKEGDYSSFFAIRKTVRGCANSNFVDSTLFFLPDDFIKTKENEADVVITLDKTKRGGNACFIPGGGTRPDTTVFSFWTRDKAGNVSDTAFSDEIIILP